MKTLLEKLEIIVTANVTTHLTTWKLNLGDKKKHRENGESKYAIFGTYILVTALIILPFICDVNQSEQKRIYIGKKSVRKRRREGNTHKKGIFRTSRVIRSSVDFGVIFPRPH